MALSTAWKNASATSSLAAFSVNLQLITIGLLPEIEPEKVTYLGNGSLLGCKINCLTNSLRRSVGEVVNMMTNFELATTPSYMDHYMGALFLPHTELNYFPKVKARLEALHQ